MKLPKTIWVDPDGNLWMLNKGFQCHAPYAPLADLEALKDALSGILDAATVPVHMGYDNGPGGGNALYKDALVLDDAAIEKARALLDDSKEASGD